MAKGFNMVLKYETGIATLIQFILITLLSFCDDSLQIVTACRAHDQCVSNAISSIVLMILTAFWFAIVWAFGFMAQTERKRVIVKLLMAAEGLTALVALFNLRHPADKLGLVISCLDISFAVWVLLLAWRILRAKGGRIVVNNRPRRRSKPLG